GQHAEQAPNFGVDERKTHRVPLLLDLAKNRRREMIESREIRLHGVRNDLAHNWLILSRRAVEATEDTRRQAPNARMRLTKIVSTIGPASDSDANIDKLVAAGADVFRLNFSHGTHESHAAVFQRIRNAAARADREVAILQDLGGPKIRTGRLEGGR